MRRKSIAFAGFLFFLMGSFSLSLLGSFLFQKEITRDPTKNFKIHREDKLNFSLKFEEIFELGLQVSAKKFSRREIKKSDFLVYDVDDLHKKMKLQDRLVISKSAFIFPNKKPSFFSFAKVSSEEFMKHSFNYEKFVSKQENTLTVKKMMGPAGEVQIRFSFGEFDLEENKIKGMTQLLKNKLLGLAPFGKKNLKRIVTRSSSELDISNYSLGGRITDYYYEAGQHTLVFSLELATFKRNDFFEKDKKALWVLLKTNAESSQRASKKRSVMRMRDYLYQ